MTLEDVLNRTIDLLQHPEFKNFGALQKHRYQMEKWKNPEDIELMRDLYSGTKMTAEQMERQRLSTEKSIRRKKKKLNRLDKYTKRLSQIQREQSRKKFNNHVRAEQDINLFLKTSAISKLSK